MSKKTPEERAARITVLYDESTDDGEVERLVAAHIRAAESDVEVHTREKAMKDAAPLAQLIANEIREAEDAALRRAEEACRAIRENAHALEKEGIRRRGEDPRARQGGFSWRMRNSWSSKVISQRLNPKRSP